jgi:hypothetical protein
MHGDAVSDSAAALLRAGFGREAREGGGAKQDENSAAKLRHRENLVDSAPQGQKIARPWNWPLENHRRSGYEGAVNLSPHFGAKSARPCSRNADRKVLAARFWRILSLQRRGGHDVKIS